MDSITHNAGNNTREKKDEFHRIVSLYLESNPLLSTNNKSSELEIRFGTERVRLRLECLMMDTCSTTPMKSMTFLVMEGLGTLSYSRDQPR